MTIRFGEEIQVIPVLAPVLFTNSCACSQFIDLNMANWVSFLVDFGVTSATNVTISVEASSIGSSAGATKIGFDYRLSSAVSTQGWGAITDGTTAGVAILSAAATNASVLIDVDPAEVQLLGEQHRWVGVRLTPTSSLVITAGISAFIQPRYPGNSIPSSS
jgi:hypothetical protein